MTALPLVTRELRLRARRPQTQRIRFWVALAGALGTLGLLTIGLSTGQNPGQIGGTLFAALALMGLGCGLVAGPVLTADSVSEERRQGTLGLLLLAHLSGYEIVLGKLATTSLVACHALLGLVPMLALAFFLGGVTASAFALTLLLLAMALGFSLTAGLFMSCWCVSGRSALLGTGLLVGTVSLGPLAGQWVATRLEVPSLSLLLAVWPNTPRAIWEVATGLAARTTHPLGLAGALGLMGLGFVLGAGILVQRLGLKDVFPVSRPKPAKSTLLDRGGLAGWQQRSRRRVLDENPAIWLAVRRGFSPLLLSGLWGLAVLTWPATVALKSSTFQVEAWHFVAVHLVHLVFKGWVAWEASRDLTAGFRRGAIELLLVTPLGTRKVLAGWLIGFRRRLLGPLLLVVGADLLLGIGLADTRLLAIQALSVGLLVADVHALSWVSLWEGVRCTGSTRVLVRTVARVLVSPAIGFLGVLGCLGLMMDEGPAPELIVGAWFLVGYVSDGVWCWWADSRLDKHHRELPLLR